MCRSKSVGWDLRIVENKTGVCYWYFMTAEIPQWARQERQRDREWIRDNLHVFVPTAKTAFAEQGRGAIVVDTTLQPVTGQGNPFAYFPQDKIEATGDEDTMRLVREYNPEEEFVLVMLKPQDRTSTYRVQAFQRLWQQGDQENPAGPV